MVILKSITAYDQLCSFAQDNWDKVGSLVHYIVDNNFEDRFDNYITDLFPKGCYDSEFEEFCTNKQDEIMNNI